MEPAHQSASAVLEQKESELLTLRQTAVRNLEAQVSELRSQHGLLQASLQALQADFEYNLEILDGRDAELEQYDHHFAALSKELATQRRKAGETDVQLKQAQKDLGKEREQAAAIAAACEQEMKRVRASCKATESSCQAELYAMQSKLEHEQRTHQAQLAKPETLFRQQIESLKKKHAEQLHALKGQVFSMERRAGDLQQHLADTEDRHLQHIARLQQQQEASDAGLKADLARMSSMNDALRADSERARTDLARRLQSASEQYTAEKDVLCNRLTASQALVEELQRQLDAESHSQLTAAESHERLQSLLAVSQEANADLQMQLASALRRGESEAARHMQEKDILERQVVELQRRVAKLRTVAQQAAATTRSLQEREQDAWKEVEALRQQLQLHCAARQNAERDNKAQAATLKQAEASLRSLLHQRDTALQESQDAAYAKESTDTSARAQLLSENRSLQAALKEARAEIQSLKGSIAVLSADMEAVAHHTLQQRDLAAPVQEAELEIAQRELAACQKDVQRLAAENERLMEISNELRSERKLAIEPTPAAQPQLLGAQLPPGQLRLGDTPHYSIASPYDQLNMWSSPPHDVYRLQVPLEELYGSYLCQAVSWPPFLGWPDNRGAAVPMQQGETGTRQLAPQPDELLARLERIEQLAQQSTEMRESARPSPPKQAPSAQQAPHVQGRQLPVLALARSTQSQTAKLRLLQQRQAAAVPKVRNYNIKDPL